MICQRCCKNTNGGYAHTCTPSDEWRKLEAELAAIKAELREINTAIDDPACDLTHTAAECIKKLKAENESLKRDAARYRWLRDQHPSNKDGYAIGYFDTCGVDAWQVTTPHLEDALNAAMAQGEKG